MAKKTDNTKVILQVIEDFGKLLTDRVSDLYQVRGAIHYRHNFVHYRGILWEAREYIKAGKKKEAIESICDLSKYLRERYDDIPSDEKMTKQGKHCYEYYMTFTDKIYNLLTNLH